MSEKFTINEEDSFKVRFQNIKMIKNKFYSDGSIAYVKIRGLRI